MIRSKGDEKMKFYTKEFYEEMQVAAFITFPPSREEWNEFMDSLKEDKKDYIDNGILHLELMKDDLLKYLPTSLHKSIHDKTIVTDYPSSENLRIINQWRESFNTKAECVKHASIERYESIKNELPTSVVHLQEEALHDAEVISFECKPEEQKCYMILEHYKNGKSIKVKLTFTNVKELSVDENIKGAKWLYDEVSGNASFFEVNILFYYPLTEFHMKAASLEFEIIDPDV